MTNIYLVLTYVPHPFGGAGWFQPHMAFTSKRMAQVVAKRLSPSRRPGTISFGEPAKVMEIHLSSPKDKR